jgi:hypothetical protein
LQHHASEADAAAFKEAGVYENLIASREFSAFAV